MQYLPYSFQTLVDTDLIKHYEYKHIHVPVVRTVLSSSLILVNRSESALKNVSLRAKTFNSTDKWESPQEA